MSKLGNMTLKKNSILTSDTVAKKQTPVMGTPGHCLQIGLRLRCHEMCHLIMAIMAVRPQLV